MEAVRQRGLAVELLPYERGERFFAHVPEELFEIEGSELDVLLFGGNDDALHVLPYGEERPSFDVVVAAIFDEVFDEVPRLREHLDLVEDDQRFAFVQIDVVVRRQVEEQGVEIGAIVLLISLGARKKSITRCERYSLRPNSSTSVLFPTRRAPSTRRAVFPSLLLFHSTSRS